MKTVNESFVQDGYEAKLRLMLWEDVSFRPEGYLRPLILVCPGGAYSTIAVDEEDVIAVRFSAMGYHTAILEYSCSKEGIPFPVQLDQLAAAVKRIKDNATLWRVDAEKIVVVGFSAGGHLAASFGVYWDDDFVRSAVGVEPGELKIAGMILGYPAISAKSSHKGSFRRLMVGHDEDFLERLSLEKQVSPKTPVAFIWHTWEDASVRVEHSLVFAQALRKAGVPFDLHIYQRGPHGLSTADEQVDYKPGMIRPAAQLWLSQVQIWLKELFSNS